MIPRARRALLKGADHSFDLIELLGNHSHFLAFLLALRRLELKLETGHLLARLFIDNVGVDVLGQLTLVQRQRLVGLAISRLFEEVTHVDISVKHEVRTL